MKTKKQKSIRLKCPRKDCNHEWNYTGNSKFYVTCPHCYRKINIRNQITKTSKKRTQNQENENNSC